MELAVAAPPAASPPRRGFLIKIGLAAALVALADNLFFFQRAGATLGLFALALLVTLLLAQPALRRRPAALAAAAAALLFAGLLVEDPSLLACALFWSAAATAVLLPRTAAFDDGWRWARRLLWYAVAIPAAPLRDWLRLRAARRRTGPAGIARRFPVLLLPLGGSLIFLLLFSMANPLIGNAFSRLDLFVLLGGVSFTRFLFWVAATMAVWSLLRPRAAQLWPARKDDWAFALPGVSLASVTLSLFAFNAVFALQNGLDVAFLWSGAPLPDGMTLAEYAHRGAYPLIATALLAGLFVLVILRPAADSGASALIRRLVYLWIAQNVLLVASTMLRTLDYVDAYSLTRLRIAALIWMALVAVGLVLICYRIWRRRSGAWLINANLAAALLVLAGCALVDLGAIAASWNVRHAREVGGPGSALDLCYLNHLGPSALLPLAELEGRRLDPAFRERVAWSRNLILDRLETSQADWHGWTWRNARRLAAARSGGLPRYSADRRHCDGVKRPLTAAAGR
jgi:hypothetical protein